MKNRVLSIVGFISSLILLSWFISGCETLNVPELNAADAVLAKNLGMEPDVLARLKAKPLYEFDEKELDLYLQYLYAAEPDLRKRVVHIGRKNIGQPYEIFLLGEHPFELHDPQPLYCLEKSDCVVFSEHTYAMALSKSWSEFIVFLQRIRFKNGEIGVLTRNHFTMADWDVNNSWLVEDISKNIAGENAEPITAATRRNTFFKNRYGIEVDMDDRKIHTFFVPLDYVPEVLDQLQSGDFVNVIFGGGDNGYAGHVGLITVDDDGEVNFLHSTPPRVREQPLMEYARNKAKSNAGREEAGKTPFTGFKFFRLRENPLERLRKIDGPQAPVVTAPLGVTRGQGRRWTPDHSE